MHPTHAPLRVATGAYILNSGLGKLGADAETAAALHGMASTAYPAFRSVQPTTFAKVLGAGEVALGAALLAPMVPSAVAGTALTGFGVGLLGMYARVPGLRREGSIRPTQQGVPIAKDVWLVGAGTTLALQGFFGGVKKAGKAAGRKLGEARESAVEALPFTD